MFERKLFVVARYIVLVAMTVLSVVFLAGATYYVAKVLYPSTHVSSSSVFETLKTVTTDSSNDTGSSESDKVFRNLRLPATVQTSFTGHNRDVLAGWLEPLTLEQRQDFLDNLEEVSVAASKHKLDVTDAQNAYKTIKLEKIRDVIRNEEGNKLAGVIILASSLIIFVLLTLILVVMAVERNTRRGMRDTL